MWDTRIPCSQWRLATIEEIMMPFIYINISLNGPLSKLKEMLNTLLIDLWETLWFPVNCHWEQGLNELVAPWVMVRLPIKLSPIQWSGKPKCEFSYATQSYFWFTNDLKLCNDGHSLCFHPLSMLFHWIQNRFNVCTTCRNQIMWTCFQDLPKTAKDQPKMFSFYLFLAGNVCK